MLGRIFDDDLYVPEDEYTHRWLFPRARSTRWRWPRSPVMLFLRPREPDPR